MIRHLNIRLLTEEKEEGLSPFAAKSRYSRGRTRYEKPCPIRTSFQRDRDRILYSKAFRRLKHKTQVFVAPLGDHYVTRLTHTLEVAQIARTISRGLNLNEDLTEAIALGHDLGHTPFGHAGEAVLDEIFPKGFHHNEQSLRVVDVIEKDGQGLNLTWEVRDGILNHSKAMADILREDLGKPSTLEGQICKISDAVAYINHDIEDAVRAGIISEGDLPLAAISVLGCSHSERINSMVCDIIEFSWGARGENPAESPVVGMSSEVLKASNTLRNFLFKRVYSVVARDEAEKGKRVVRELYKYLIGHPETLPTEYQRCSDFVEQQAVDYIAGMTDHFAFRLAEELGLVK